LLLKGVVLATYVTDDDGHPLAGDESNQPSAVYCDVAVYPSIPRQRWFFMSKVLVTTARGGVHDDDTWIPRATTTNIVTGALDDTTGSNPGQLDGDHVLIGFLNDSFSEPVILRGIPHPSRDVGNEDYSTGKRLKLKLVDGNADYRKFKGVFRGVDSDGNHVVDSTHGHDGELLEYGLEPPPDTTGTSGNQSRRLPKDSTHEISFWDMSDPVSPVKVGNFKCNKEMFEILLTSALKNCIKVEGNDTSAKLTLGDGAVSATIAEHFQTWWTDEVKAWLDRHTHPTGTGPSGAPIPAPGMTPAWDGNMTSDKVTFPDNDKE
jgi:hypothetical protein